jgi:hypothetical protein
VPFDGQLRKRKETISRRYIVEPACSLQPSQSGERLGIDVCGSVPRRSTQARTDGSCPGSPGEEIDYYRGVDDE